ncbi:MotA/TolQ/ExbB proton channel family protein [Hyphococcus flavus]|uniref:MotA/TolQ/ExbB proton channel family protein n=1 Tax=Hyphococcus flavus TaxID=1866326 RepID=A0AAF0CGD7_9PROT|nr:MotA/TolQ/ExbB proton channel family protein [Hyphococcus flavus]WDI32249.1 MotA/TolQ/ExbB proton channel family protein [Hyphococcus flavus]
MKLFKLASLSLIAGVTAASMDFSSGAMSSANAQVTLDQVLQAVRQERSEVSQENREREQRFLQQRNQQQAELTRVRNQVAAEEAESTRLEGVMEENQERIAELDSELASKQGEFQELFGAARTAAADLSAQVQSSIISSQFPGREVTLMELAQTEKLPTEDQLRDLWEIMIQQMSEQGKTVTYNTTILGADGQEQEETITRIGPFVAFSGDRYLTFNESGKLRFLPRQPSGAIRGAASRVENASGDGFVRGALDPTLGTLLGLVVETPTLKERFDQGGPVGRIIGIVTVLGVLLGVYKWVTLTMTAGAVRSQVRRKKASKANPLGRVMLAYENTNSNDVETVALKLDDAILKEVPKLEGGLNLVKVLAAVAPLLGLLGTVIGMINTFQAITLFGTGDPQIMASGISEALVTTVLGLIAAIPLLLLHAFAAGASKRVTQILEEQAAGIIAEHAEGGRA